MEKIFCIGLGRTGTKSLTKAMSILGYNAKHGLQDIKDIYKYDFVSDIGIACRYEFLDYIFPNSKFIITTRYFDEWISSTKNYARTRKITFETPRCNICELENRFMIYRSISFDYEKFKKGYIDFHEKVFKYFKHREKDLLIMNISRGDSWEKLCKFLGKNIPNIPFPHENKLRKLVHYEEDSSSK